MTPQEIVLHNPLEGQEAALLEMSEKGTEIERFAQHFEVDDVSDYEEAVRWIQTWRGEVKEREAWMKPMVSAANKMHKLMTGKLNELVGPLTNAIGVMTGKVTQHRVEQKRIADEEARKERIKLEAAEKDRREAAALEAAEANDEVGFRRSERMVDAPVPVPDSIKPAALMEKAAPKLKGVVDQMEWVCEFEGDEIESMKALCASIASDGGLPTHLVRPDWPAIRKFAKATRGTVPTPGIRCEERLKTIVKGG